jgi:hypothetical protein
MSLASLFEGIPAVFAIAVAFLASSAIATIVARRMMRRPTVDRSVAPTATRSASADILQVSSATSERDDPSTGMTKAEFGPASRKVG